MDLSAQIGTLKLANPLMAASGCYGYGVEYADAVDLRSLGAVVSKGLFLKPREGHPPERIVETPSGMLNAIGLQGIGVHRYIAEKLPELRRLGATNVINICGSTLDEYVELARILSDAEGVHALELNISCPNIKEGGITFGCSLHGTFDVVKAVKKVTNLPVIPKLTPNVTDVASIAKAAEDAGADAVSLVNTFLAMAIDVETRRPKLSNIVGGLSGPAIRPIAVRMVYECRRAVKIPVIGMGGIATATDALEFMIAGATAVQVGTAYLFCPEAKVNPVHREALKAARDDGTALTNVFTGRAARSLVNRLVREVGPISDVAPQFPAAAGAVQALSNEGSRRGLPDFTPLWAGQAASLGRPTSASELTRNLSQEAFALLRSLAEQAPGVRPGP